MQKYTIQLMAINDVKDFVNAVAMLTEDIDLASGRYTVDGKSIMGIFSLDLSKPIEVTIHGDDDKHYQELLKPFMQ